MFNAATKLILPCSLIFLISCGGGSDKPDPAQELFAQAEAQLEAGNPESVITLLDSIKTAFPDSIAMLRRGMVLRREAVLQQIQKQMIATDDSINICMEEVNRLKPLMKTVNNPRLVEPYYVAAAGYNPDFMSSTGIQACVDEAGQFYLKSSVQSTLKHTGITLSSSDGTSASAGPVPFDGELNYRINGSEVITFSPVQSAAIGQFAVDHRGSGATLTFTGGKKHSIKLSSKQVDAIATCYEYSKAMTTGRHLTFQREKLNRQEALTLQQIEQLRQSQSGE